MDYHSIHGNDVASFDISSSHRLPTVSASAALEELESNRNAYISCGLEGLDRVIAGSTVNDESSSVRGVVRRGQVTELWGPPGTGKTAFALQAAANAVCDGHGVVWVDCFQTCPSRRIATVLQAVRKARGQDIIDDPRGDEKFAPFTHYECLTLPHLIALVSRPTTRSVPSNVGLVVVSSVTALINSALPRPKDGKQGLNSNRAPNPSVRRRQALQSIMKALQTLASTRNCAVVILSQCATRMQSDRSATLAPAVNANVWEQGVSTRLVLFRDWIWQNTKSAGVFLIGLQKLDGKDTPDTIEHISAFKVNADGIVAVPHDEGHRRSADGPDVTQPKRKLAQTDFEIPDSEDDEDYGWANEDEAYLPPLPQQWQGSEDILLGHDVGQSDEENNVEDDEDRTSDEPDA